MSNDWICVWSTCNFFFSIMPNVSSTMSTTCNSSIIWLQVSKQVNEKKNHFESVPWQNRAKVDDSNAINIVSIDAYICTIPIHVVQYTNSVYKHIWRPMVMHSRGENPLKFHLISIRASTWITYTHGQMYRLTLYAQAHTCSCVSMWFNSA